LRNINLVHLSVGRACTQNTLIQIYTLYLPVLLLVVILAMVFHPPTVLAAEQLAINMYAASAISPYVNLSMG